MPPDEIVKQLLKAFWLYGHYPVQSRGPAGLFVGVIEALRPDVAAVIHEDGAVAAWKQFFDEGDD